MSEAFVDGGYSLVYIGEIRDIATV